MHSPPTILAGKAEDVLPGLPASYDEYFSASITSPPYYGLRDYQHPDQLGAEETPEEYLAKLVHIFHLARPRLHCTGTLWVVIADSYADDTKWGGQTGGKHAGGLHGSPVGRAKRKTGLQGGNLLGIPWRFALAMQADGWILRRDLIWNKPNCMSESMEGWRWEPHRVKRAGAKRGSDGSYHVKAYGEKPQGARDGREFDSQAEWEPCPGCSKCEANNGLVLRKGSGRSTSAHEYIFCFAKTPEYYFDSFAIREPSVSRHPSGNGFNRPEQISRGGPGCDRQWEVTSFRNNRSVWTLTTRPFSARKYGFEDVNHFATYPVDLVVPMLLAGTSDPGVCSACGMPSVRIIRRGEPDLAHQQACGGDRTGQYNGHSQKDYAGGKAQDASATKKRILASMVEKVSSGWKPSCRCGAPTVPARVLDPFCGAGTTLRVAHHHGREAMGIELNPRYIPLAHAHIADPLPTPKLPKRKPVRMHSPPPLSLLTDWE